MIANLVLGLMVACLLLLPVAVVFGRTETAPGAYCEGGGDGR
ncbi:hypothetical protein ACWCPK_42710 [Streptomyces sp. NPDC001953]